MALFVQNTWADFVLCRLSGHVRGALLLADSTPARLLVGAPHHGGATLCRRITLAPPLKSKNVVLCELHLLSLCALLR